MDANKKTVHELMQNYMKHGDTVEINNGKIVRIIPGYLAEKGVKKNVYTR